MLNNLLLYRLIIFNTLAAAAVFYAYELGYVKMLLERDSSGIVEVIVALLGLAIISTFTRGYKISKTTNDLKEGKYVDILKVKKMRHKNEHIRDIAGWAVLIGLFGNALGFIIALSGSELSDTLLAGAGVAFGSTVAGIFAALWTEINFSMIRTATATLNEDIEGSNG